MRYNGSQIQLDVPGFDEHTYPSGRGVVFVPSVFRWPGLAVNPLTATPTISYPSRGAALLWEAVAGNHASSALMDLVGRTRAILLADLDVPRSTTALARRHGLAAATVSQHLAVLSGAGLATSHRKGRVVLYSRTALAVALTNPGARTGLAREQLE